MGVEVTTITTRTNTDLGVSRASNVHRNARGGAGRPSTTSHACSSVRSAARSASAFPQGIMGIKLYALATITGRPRKEDQSALEQASPSRYCYKMNQVLRSCTSTGYIMLNFVS
ncbi:hypothetical protein OIU76_028262 [Salix suchowensis]|nr:hypothetical protein OIU78_026100 [Salix suchowensis]KAJ6369963.1 hypothetical protein OIU76_028262 [Salix suchowensis]